MDLDFFKFLLTAFIAILALFVPAFLTFVFNAIFLVFIQRQISKSLERFKVSYSGIYKERIDIYRELLKRVLELKNLTRDFTMKGDNDELAGRIMKASNDLIDFYFINQAFVSKNVDGYLKEIREKLNKIFEAAYSHFKIGSIETIPKEKKDELIDNYFEALKEIRSNNVFYNIESTIIQEMRKDLNLDKV